MATKNPPVARRAGPEAGTRDAHTIPPGPGARKALAAAEAEVAVLGACLIDADAILLARRLLTVEAFSVARHRVIYRAMLRLADAGQAIDPVTLAEDLRARGELEDAGGMVYIAELLDAVPTAANLEYHARIVADRAARRRLHSIGHQIAAAAADPDLDIAEVRARIEQHARDVDRLGGIPGASRISAPLSVAELMEVDEPEERWIAEGLIPAEANVLVAGYPKTHKTNFLLELGVAATTTTPFLGRFDVPARYRVGIVLMEDRPHRVRRRLERIAQAHGVALSDLDGWLYLWFRPPIRLSEPGVMAELAAHVEAFGLDVLMLDNWALVATGDSNNADEVTPQLDALTGLRESRPNLTVILVHHARKAGQDRGAERLTDMIRNSSAFGAWYDAGLVLARADELSPVTVRTELRDLPSPEPFTFTVEDQFPAGPDYGVQPGGWLRLVASDRNPALVEREAQAARFKGAVLEFLRANPGVSKRQLRDGIEGNNELILAAFDALVEEGSARFEKPEKRGQAGRCYATVPDRAQSVPGAHPEVTVPTVPAAPIGGGTAAHFHPVEPGDRAGHTPSRSETYPCARCGRHRFPKPKTLCFECRNANKETYP